MAINDELDANGMDANGMKGQVHDLSKSIERMKSRHADRDDVVVELRQTQLTRMELLARDLQSVFNQVPIDNDQFEFALTSGETPRLWLDMTTHVRMGAMRHEYELVKDTRMGRTILAASTDRNQMGKVITDYIADKMLERERLIEGEWIAIGGYEFDAANGNDSGGLIEGTQAAPVRKGWGAMVWFMIGSIISVSSLFAWAWYSELPTYLQ